MAKQAVSHKDIVDSVRKRNFAPVYLLMGEEAYYIDRIADFIAASVLPEADQAFNQQTIYCTKETDVTSIINAARRYPMMAEYQVLIVKEVQNLQKIDELSSYVNNPLKTTILVICHKYGNVDKRKKLVAQVEKNGVVFESAKLREDRLPGFVADYLRRKQKTIQEDANQVIAEYIGSDLNRIASELDKLVIGMKEGETTITLDMVQRSIGISKEYNVWELRDALIVKNAVKAYRIVHHTCSSGKKGDSIQHIGILFSFFAQLMVAWYSPDRSTRGIAQHLGLKSEYAARDYFAAMKSYTALKTLQIIDKLRETDGKLKGINAGGASDEDIMIELISFILH